MTLFRMSIFLLFFLGFTLRAEVQQKNSKTYSSQTLVKRDKSFFSLGISTGISLADRLIGKNLRTLEELNHLRFRFGGLGVPFGIFLDLRIFDNFSLMLDGFARAHTGAHIQNDNRIWYSYLLSFSGTAGAKYQFEIPIKSQVYRPFIGFGGGVSGSSLRIMNTRESDKESYALYEYYFQPKQVWKAFIGYKFLLASSFYMDLFFQINRFGGGDAIRNLSSADHLEGEFEIDLGVTKEMNGELVYFEIKPFITYEILLNFAWWL